MLDELRVDLLIETQRYDDAVAFYESVAGNGFGVDVEARQRLIKLYEAAGRPDDMVREYRRLMSAEPDAVHWFTPVWRRTTWASPATEDALAVWRRFEAANEDRPQAVVAAGEEMIGMGFLEEAVAMIERQMAEDRRTRRRATVPVRCAPGTRSGRRCTGDPRAHEGASGPRGTTPCAISRTPTNA